MPLTVVNVGATRGCLQSSLF